MSGDLAERCQCGGCDPACPHRPFKPCCGACMIGTPHYNEERDAPEAFWPAYLKRHPDWKPL